MDRPLLVSSEDGKVRWPAGVAYALHTNHMLQVPPHAHLVAIDRWPSLDLSGTYSEIVNSTLFQFVVWTRASLQVVEDS